MAWFSVVKAAAWPLVKKAAGQVAVYVAAHPEAQDRLAQFGRRLADVQKARTPEGKVRRGLEPIREHAREVIAGVADQSSPTAIQAEGWLHRADHIERALAILEHRPRASRKQGLASVIGMADALTAEVLMSLIDPPEGEGSSAG